MRLLIFECKKIIMNRFYLLYILLFLVFCFLSIKPFDAFNDVSPMDEQHILVKQVLIDSKKEVIENEFIDWIITEYADSLSVAKLQNNQEVIDDLEEKIKALNSYRTVVLSKYQKEYIQSLAEKLVEGVTENGYTVDELISLDTIVFQRIKFSISDLELDKELDNLNVVLGGVSHYSDFFDLDGSNFRRDIIEFYSNRYISDILDDSLVYSKDYKEIVKAFDEEINQFGYAGFFKYFIIDKLGIIICVLMPLVMFLSMMQNRYGMKDLIRIKRCSSFRIVINKTISSIISTLIPLGVILVFFSTILNLKACEIGLSIDLFDLFFSAIYILLPEILIIISVDVLLIVLLDSNIPTIIVSSLVFGISVDDFWGKYKIGKVLLRFNKLGNLSSINEYDKDIFYNRVFYILVSFIVVLFAVIAYSYFRYNSTGSKSSIKTKLKKSRTIQALLNGLEQKSYSKKPNGIVGYQMKIGYWYSFTLSLIYSIIVICLFKEDMKSLQLLQRFYPLCVVIINLGFVKREQLPAIKDLLTLRKTIGVDAISFVCSFVFSILMLLFYCIICQIVIIDALNMLLISLTIGVLISFFKRIMSIRGTLCLTVAVYSCYLMIL
ncbi:MAG: hypothetical protein IK014_02810 [Lachnospiraceae bacterium]|nr:hypothetical protein [Lachnospiraceae bacterium]